MESLTQIPDRLIEIPYLPTERLVLLRIRRIQHLPRDGLFNELSPVEKRLPSSDILKISTTYLISK